MYDNAIFRERFYKLEREESLTLAEVAIRCGWGTDTKPDSSRVARQLGINKDCGEYRTEVTQQTAECLCKALHIDPYEVPDL